MPPTGKKLTPGAVRKSVAGRRKSVVEPGPPAALSFPEFCRRYAHGCGSNQCPGPDRPNTLVCLGRGQLPCDVLFVGEAPGESENAVGRPFVEGAPAGRLLEWIAAQALGPVALCTVCGSVRQRGDGGEGNWRCANGHTRADGGGRDVRCAFTNLVCCIPRNDEAGGKADEPDDDQVKACAVRLQQFVRLADPRLIVTVGKPAEDWLDPTYRHAVSKGFHRPIPTAAIQHPAYLLRLNQAQRGLAIQRAVVTLRNAVERLDESPRPV